MRWLVACLVMALASSGMAQERPLAVEQAVAAAKAARASLEAAKKGKVKYGVKTGVIDDYGVKVWVFGTHKDKEQWLDRLEARVKEKVRLLAALEAGDKQALYLAASQNRLKIDDLHHLEAGVLLDSWGNPLVAVVQEVKDANYALAIICWIELQDSSQSKKSVQVYLRGPTAGLATGSKVPLGKPQVVKETKPYGRQTLFVLEALAQE